jgi:hypothetical protein
MRALSSRTVPGRGSPVMCGRLVRMLAGAGEKRPVVQALDDDSAEQQEREEGRGGHPYRPAVVPQD